MLNAGSGDMTPPRSLGRCAPAVRLRRALPAFTELTLVLSTESGDNAPQKMCAKKRREKKGRAGGAFSIGSASPWRTSQKSDDFRLLKPGRERNPMWLKDARNFFLTAPSCASTFPPCSLPVSFPLLWPRYLIPRLTLSSV